MKHQSKFSNDENLENAVTQASEQEKALEFESVEELIRFDSSNTAVPSVIKGRLQESIANEPPPKDSSWWSKLFGK